VNKVEEIHDTAPIIDPTIITVAVVEMPELNYLSEIYPLILLGGNSRIISVSVVMLKGLKLWKVLMEDVKALVQSSFTILRTPIMRLDV